MMTEKKSSRPILSMDDHDFETMFREAVKAKIYDEFNIQTPAFNRTDGRTVAKAPETLEEFFSLRKAPEYVLEDLGLRQWASGHWLYPAEWYDKIPEGLDLFSINGEEIRFERGVTDNDMRFGMLAYGFIRHPK